MIPDPNHPLFPAIWAGGQYDGKGGIFKFKKSSGSIFRRLKFDKIDSLVGHSANAQQMVFCGTNGDVNPASGAIVALDYAGTIQWYNSIGQIRDDYQIGANSCKGVSHRSDGQIATVLEVETVR